MLRSGRCPLIVLLFSLSTHATAHAQGWGWDAWGGWASTPDTSLAQGMGHFYQGLGIFNAQTAIAHSIDADTVMRWNDDLHHANDEALRRYVAKRRENSRNIRAQNDAINTRIRDNPTVRDIEMGDALNAAVNQLTDPKVSSAALRAASARIEAKIIQEIAFRNAGAAVVIVLSSAFERASRKWADRPIRLALICRFRRDGFDSNADAVIEPFAYCGSGAHRCVSAEFSKRRCTWPT